MATIHPLSGSWRGPLPKSGSNANFAACLTLLASSLAACATDDAAIGPFTIAHAQTAIQRLETEQIERLFDGDFEKPVDFRISNVAIVKEGTVPESGGRSAAFWNAQADLQWRCASGESIQKAGKIYMIVAEGTSYAAVFDLYHGRGPEGCRKKG